MERGLPLVEPRPAAFHARRITNDVEWFVIRLSARQCREVDRIAIEEYGIPGIVLMENAARGVADAVDRLKLTCDAPASALVLCGKGNNGGDGLAVARHLLVRGYDVSIILCCNPAEYAGDALVNYKTAVAFDIRMGSLESPPTWRDGPLGTIVVDAIYGTGFRVPSRLDLRPLRPIVHGRMSPVVAVDLPSGMEADTGLIDADNCLQSNVTVTFGAQKTGFANPDAQPYLGDVMVADIGVPMRVIERAAATPL